MTQYDAPMEQEIIKEENIEKGLPLRMQTLPTRLKNLTTRLKRPKPITLIILFSTVILISVALNLVSKNNQDKGITPTAFQTSTPSPEGSTDPGTENIAQRVKLYNEKLNSFKNYQQSLEKPIVDLAISFKQ